MSHDLAILSHHKCATNWLRRICDELAARDLISIEIASGRGSARPETEASTLRVFLNVNATRYAHGALRPEQGRNVHFVRDPRDALVSNYFSWLYSHEASDDEIVSFRQRAPQLSVEEGMLELLPLFRMGRQLQTWPDAMWERTRTVRYEDLLSDFRSGLLTIFAPEILELSDDVVSEVEAATSFRAISGREAGAEDPKKHFRKGQAGDWRNHFTPRLEAAFQAEYGWLGTRLGYW